MSPHDLQGAPASLPTTPAQPSATVQQPRPLVRVTIRVLGKGCCEEGAQLVGTFGPASSTTNMGQQASATAPPIVVGFVTSASPRGARGYPGGGGLCCALSLWRLRSLQHIGRHGAGDAVADVLLSLRNPGSTALRRVAVQIVLEHSSSDPWL